MDRTQLMKNLAKNKLVQHQSQPYQGYRLTSKGYDYLGLRTLTKRGTIGAMGIQIGVGKESDIFTVHLADGSEAVLKLHRLGRNCFKTVKNNRDYLKPGQTIPNWLYLSRLSALKEFAFMTALHAKGFSVPTPHDVNRHCLIMSLTLGYQVQMRMHDARDPHAACRGSHEKPPTRAAHVDPSHGNYPALSFSSCFYPVRDSRSSIPCKSCGTPRGCSTP